MTGMQKLGIILGGAVLGWTLVFVVLWVASIVVRVIF